MKAIYSTAAWLALMGTAHATSIEHVTLLADDGGNPGAEVAMFAPEDRLQHFSIKLDEMKVGQHSFVVEFWADETVLSANEKITEFETNGLLANTISAQIKLPNEWPTGWYRLDVKMDGKPVGSHRYVVSKPWTKQSINYFKLYRDDGNGNAGAETEAFAATDKVQHFEMQSDGYLKRGALLKIVYTAIKTSAGDNRQVQSVDYAVPMDDAIFNILTSYVSLPREWPTGTYQIAVYDGARLLGKHQYEVR